MSAMTTRMPSAGEGLDDGQPDAAGCAGDDGRPPLEMLHWR